MDYPIVNLTNQSKPQMELASANELSQQQINKILKYIKNDGQNLTPVRFQRNLNDRKVTKIE